MGLSPCSDGEETDGRGEIEKIGMTWELIWRLHQAQPPCCASALAQTSDA